MRLTRRFFQIIFLLFFLYLFFQAVYPLESYIPPDLFLRLNPLAAVTTFIAERSFIATLIPALILLIMIVFLGRFFCGWICPLGTIIDLNDKILKKKKAKSKPSQYRRWRAWKFIIIVALLLAAIFSIQLIGFFDPIVILTRTLTTSLFPMLVNLVEASLELLMKVEWLEEPVYELYDLLHLSILPIEPHYFQSGTVFLLIFMGILLVGLITPRFWCRNICPLGALLGIFSKYRLLQRVVDSSCTNCGKCQRECKMDAIEDDFSKNSTIECIECMNCVATCPPKSIRYKFNWMIFRLPGHSSQVDLSKRQFIGSTIGGALAVGAVGADYVNREQKGKVIRPPGALEESRFLDRCLRCHECSRICATSGGCLQPALFESGLEGLWTPISVPRTGFCEHKCNLCGQVCPTGAIKKLELSEKQKMKMGTASFDKNRCIPWYRLENCLVCEEHCPISDKAIHFEIKKVIRPDGKEVQVKFPYVIEDRCDGCGICVTKCPLAGKAGIFVSNAGEIRADSV